jgi:hypothetical protein
VRVRNSTATVFDQRGVWAALALRELIKPNCSRSARMRKASRIK